MWNDPFARVAVTPSDLGFSPSFDMKEVDGGYEITAELPGVKKEDISMDLHDGILTLKGEKKEEFKEEKENMIRSERRYGSFERSVRVPDGVTAEHVKARMDNGLLSVKIETPERTMTPTRIDIADGSEHE